VSPPGAGLLGTSVFIAREVERPLGDLPEQVAVSVVTIGELQLGVLAAPEATTRVQRAHRRTSSAPRTAGSVHHGPLGRTRTSRVPLSPRCACHRGQGHGRLRACSDWLFRGEHEIVVGSEACLATVRMAGSAARGPDTRISMSEALRLTIVYENANRSS
jgi:hypothetical protein